MKDTSGSVLVTRTKEAGGVRVSTKQGHPDDIVCDTPNLPDDLTPDTWREMIIYRDTVPTSNLFETYPECDDKERPSLRVRFNDIAAQDAILALP